MQTSIASFMRARGRGPERGIIDAMPLRLTQFLAALVTTLAFALAPCANFAIAATDAHAASDAGACCGGNCTCGDSCPCAGGDERSDDERGSQDAPREREERRSVGSPLPQGAPAAPAIDETGVSRGRAEPAAEAHAPAGRELLALISKWTT